MKISSIALTLLAGGVLDAAAQDARPVRVVPDFASRSFVLEYDDAGETRRITLNPSAGLAPEVRSTLDVLPGDVYVYSYAVTNLARATQLIRQITIPATSARQPNGPTTWQLASAERGRVSWQTPIAHGDAGARTGLQPGGSEAGFTFTSAMLPGPVRAEFRSGAARIVPAHMPPAVLDQLRTLPDQDYLTRPVISASINGMLGEPELTLDVFLARVNVNYLMHLDRSSHPGRSELLGALRDAIDHAQAARDREARQAVARALAVPGLNLDPWAHELHKALGLCLTYSAKVPVARLR